MMYRKRIREAIATLGLTLLAAACSNSNPITAPPPRVITEIVQILITSTPTQTPTSTQTPTPTPTPTPTAPPILVSGDPRTELLSDPVFQAGAPCGFVDLLDFPLDPPEALGGSGGGDFGRFRSRYDKYHAGEDWGYRSRSNFGEPVFSIGHGMVTYAEPLGWGADQGVVIIRHAFQDGSTILSFYGHLDPPSIGLRPGDCVTRGQQIGDIGRPRTPPHLHFEIRSHLPVSPGPGYWSVDPRLAGWEPPSSFIWNQRIAASPAVAWSLLPDGSSSKIAGSLSDGTLVLLNSEALVGLDPADGGLLWSHPVTNTRTAAMVDTLGEQVYLADPLGTVQAYRIPNTDSIRSLAPPDWELDLGSTGTPALLPLPNGGVLVSQRGALSGVGPDGELRWTIEDSGPALEWLLVEERLLYTTGGDTSGLWETEGGRPTELAAGISGTPVVSGEQIWVVGAEGIYQIEPDSGRAEIVYPLARRAGAGSSHPLPGGGLLVAHPDLFDSRLIALDSQGNFLWERSYGALGGGVPRLVELEGELILILEHRLGSTGTLDVYALDLSDLTLEHLFSGGTRSHIPGSTWVLEIQEEQLMIQLGGGSLFLYQP